MAVKFSPKRGRPSLEQVVAIDRAILDAARRIFLKEGYDALAMDSVAAELGVSKGTLYARHPSKEALLKAVLESAIKGWSDASARNDHLLPDDLGGRLRRHMRVFGRATADPEARGYHQLLTTIQYRIPEVALLFHDIGFARGVEIIATDLRVHAEREGRTLRDPDGSATLLLSMLTGWYGQQSAIRNVEIEEVDAHVDRAVEIFMLARDAW